MRNHVWLGLWLAATLGTSGLQAQPASPEQMQKALEMLRKTSSTPAPTNSPPPTIFPVQAAPTNNAAVPTKSTQPAQPAAPAVTPAQAGSNPSTKLAPAAPKESKPAPSVKPAQPLVQPLLISKPQGGLSAADEQKARELLHKTEVPAAPAAAATAPSLEEREQAIRSALDEAHRLDAERRQTRKQNPQAANEAAMQAEILRIEAELLKAKVDHPPSADLVRPAGTESITALPPATPPAAPPRRLPPASPTPAPVAAQPRTPPASPRSNPEAKPAPVASSPVPSKPAQPATASPSTGAPARAVAPANTGATQSPPPAASSDPKEKRLADLLEAYRKDQITAAEYHRLRAKVLAE